MNEAKIQTLFGRKNRVVGVFELKLVKDVSMPFKNVAEHQLASLYATAHDGLYHKISDASFEQKPYDCFYLAEIPAYVVPVWYIPRKRKTAYYIAIDTYCQMVDSATRKSLTEEMARVVADYVVEL
jgi:penicillin-binding protein-related factor A (putative recombinase)